MHRMSGRLVKLELAMRVEPTEQLIAGLSDMELEALVTLCATIATQSIPEQGAMRKSLVAGLRRRAQGGTWHYAMAPVLKMLPAGRSDITTPEESITEQEEAPPTPAVWIEPSTKGGNHHGV